MSMIGKFFLGLICQQMAHMVAVLLEIPATEKTVDIFFKVGKYFLIFYFCMYCRGRMEPCSTVFFELNKIVICSMPSLVRGANGTVSEIRQVGDIPQVHG